MSGTIDAIQERLDPERLTQQATEVTEQAREAAKDVAKYAIEEAKDGGQRTDEPGQGLGP